MIAPLGHIAPSDPLLVYLTAHARHAERVWYSPGCIATAAQGSLLEMAQEAR